MAGTYSFHVRKEALNVEKGQFLDEKGTMATSINRIGPGGIWIMKLLDIVCGHCDGDIRQDPLIGQGVWKGNICRACKTVFCEYCVNYEHPSPCPLCGHSLQIAGVEGVRLIGIAI